MVLPASDEPPHSAAVVDVRAGNVGGHLVVGDNNTIIQAAPVAGRVRWTVAMPTLAAHFQDRPELARLRETLAAGSRVVVAAVAGGRGVGKTQLAAAYCQECDTAGWPVVVWLPAETVTGVVEGLAAVAERVGRRVSGSSVVEAALAAVGWLAEHDGPGVVVFDNAEDPDALARWLPRSARLQVVVTTTDRRFRSLGSLVEVGVYRPAEAVAYLVARTGVDDPDGAGRVADVLGCLPLALGQAGALIGGARFPGYDAYLDALDAVEMADALPPVAGESYPHGFAAAVTLAVEAVTAAPGGVGLRRVLDVLAVLSADGAPIRFLAAVDVSDVAGGVGAAVEVLVERSLVTLTADRDEVIMHRLVQRTLRNAHRAASTLGDLIDTAAGLLGAVVPRGGEHEVAYRGVWQRLGPQVTALRQHTPDTAGDTTAAKVLHLGWAFLYHLVEVKDPRRAIEIGTVVVADARQLYGDDHHTTLSIRNDLANAYQIAGRTADAITVYEQSLPVQVRVRGAEHPETLATRHNLAAAYRVAGRMAEAITVYEQILPVLIRTFGEEHPETLTTRHNLAAAYQAAGRAAEAITVYEQILPVLVRTFGEEHPENLTTRHNLAAAYRVAGRTAEAIAVFEQILPVQVRVLGDEHPETLGTRHNLADAYHVTGRTAEAITVYEQLLPVQVRVLGDEHPGILRTRHNLAVAYHVAGRTAEAITVFEQLLPVQVRVLGDDHPETLTTRHNLATARK